MIIVSIILTVICIIIGQYLYNKIALRIQDIRYNQKVILKSKIEKIITIFKDEHTEYDVVLESKDTFRLLTLEYNNKILREGQDIRMQFSPYSKYIFGINKIYFTEEEYPTIREEFISLKSKYLKRIRKQ